MAQLCPTPFLGSSQNKINLKLHLQLKRKLMRNLPIHYLCLTDILFTYLNNPLDLHYITFGHICPFGYHILPYTFVRSLLTANYPSFDLSFVWYSNCRISLPFIISSVETSVEIHVHEFKALKLNQYCAGYIPWGLAWGSNLPSLPVPI